jgi:hypothetical protein
LSSETIFFGLAAWASFMACTAVDKLAVKRTTSKKGKTTAVRTTSSSAAINGTQ